MRERGPSFILGEAKLPLLDARQIQHPRNSDSNAFIQNPQSIRFSSQNRSLAVDIQISWIKDISVVSSLLPASL
jgi:hypothetical protein